MPFGLQKAPNALDDIREAQVVKAFDLSQLALHFAMGFAEFRVLAEHPIGAAIELEIERAAAEIFVELFVLAFTLLPAGGHDGDRAVGEIELLVELA